MTTLLTTLYLACLLFYTQSCRNTVRMYNFQAVEAEKRSLKASSSYAVKDTGKLTSCCGGPPSAISHIYCIYTAWHGGVVLCY